MQINFIDIIYGLAISGVVLIVIKTLNKKYVFKNRKCIAFERQIKHSNIINNEINEYIVRELYELIEKNFKVKSCYLNPNDKMKTFYDLSSFDMHENYEDFINYMEKKYKISIKLEDKLIDLMIKMKV